jgi:hypothetical protein
MVRPRLHVADANRVTFSGAKNVAGDIVPAFIRAKSSMALWLP